MKQLLTSAEAVTRLRQHKKPCSDCPFARTALRGWLGSMSAEEWIAAVHGEAFVECHTATNRQCAGSAIYRANVGKLCRRSDVIRLPRNTAVVFGCAREFLKHHAL